MIQVNLQNRKRLTVLENLGLPEGRERQKVWESHVHTAVFKMENQQGPAVEHKELCLMSCGSPDGRGVWEEQMRVYAWLSASAAHLKLLQHCQLAKLQNKIKS